MKKSYLLRYFKDTNLWYLYYSETDVVFSSRLKMLVRGSYPDVVIYMWDNDIPKSIVEIEKL